ncbi:MAG: autotransporter [Mesorhizobium sp.]|nr:autotransporter [bacterium M00.F.Ca.ET.205.01.1.1]TGU54503.1 autotransporter [bacterium M00.F.Ca.ET.152.01.1.1]TGV38711.1 autotransporter [Mesorhizobium sp. M00.F.Ca.ET.186.01.1.1]TGZ44075.1 autotransporter [bacterium M00.F.Ca.ET.162.01.1.1]TIW60267.1 MAG: autotransporter [Mesorhizobium sp.]
MPLSADSPLYRAIKDIVNAATGPDPFGQVKSVLSDYTNRFHALGRLVHEEDDDELLLHASPNLTIYHITLSPGVQYPPHNHLMDALIGIYSGGETNFIYPLAGDRVDEPERQDFSAPALVHMSSNTIHSVANTGSARSGALHVYLGDLPGTSRQLWRLADSRPEPFDNDRYMAGARPIRQSTSEPE